MAKKQFKAESKKLLDLMINSIYTHKEIFLRELISNASDALDKLYYTSLQSGDTGVSRKDFNINISVNKDERTITITDNGIGMTRDELEKDLGTIAKSGSQIFKDDIKESDNAAKGTDIIGQFGVGFYSAFMVADDVKVTSRAYGSDEAYIWESKGADGYTVNPAEKDEPGTKIVLHLKEDTDDEKYSDYLQEYKIRELIRKYSDYVHYPIQMMVTKTRQVEGAEGSDGPKTEEYRELDTLNSMEPIWKRQKSKVKTEDYNEYYKSKFMDYEDPVRIIRTSVEGLSSYTALLFIPGHVPYDYYTKQYEKGLQLYSSGVMIMERCKELLPDYFNFVKGLVDSQDLSLNISREMLQHDRQLKFIEKNLEKKIKKELAAFMKEDREGYEKFFANFGNQLKYGIYDNFGMNKDVLSDLILFTSSNEKKKVSLDEYVERMKEDQKYIYYAAGETVDKIEMLPQTRAAVDKGYEVLYFTDDIDEFSMKMMQSYKDKQFKSVADEDESGDTDSDKEKIRSAEEENKELISFIKDTIGDKITEVRISTRLSDSPCCLSSKGEISLEMEKTLNRMPGAGGVKADRVLEINPDSEIITKVRLTLASGDKNTAASYARLLYDQAVLLSGLDLDDPAALAADINSLINK